MSAARLRAAAALMRERAEKSLHFVSQTNEWWGVDGLRSAFLALSEDEDSVLIGFGEDAEHIASWHPAVALAVADWLGATADHADATGGHCVCDDAALAVANAYLGDPS